MPTDDVAGARSGGPVSRPDLERGRRAEEHAHSEASIDDSGEAAEVIGTPLADPAEMQREALAMLGRAGEVRDDVKSRIEEIRWDAVRRLRQISHENSGAGRVAEILDEACRELSAIPVDMTRVRLDAQPAVPDHGAESDVTWIRVVLRHVPLAITARMLQSMEIERVNRIAVAEPAVLGQLVITVTPPELAGWMRLWSDEATIAVCAVLPPAACARVLEQLTDPEAGTVVTGMGPDATLAVLRHTPRRTAAGWLLAVASRAAASLLELVSHEDAARYLLEMRALGLTEYAQITRHMSAVAGKECISHIDRLQAEKGHAKELMDRVRKNREDDRGA